MARYHQPTAEQKRAYEAWVASRPQCVREVATRFDRSVFGIDPDDLEECDLPAPEERLGAALTQDEVGDNLDALRVMVRPDLFEMMPDGKARRKEMN